MNYLKEEILRFQEFKKKETVQNERRLKKWIRKLITEIRNLLKDLPKKNQTKFSLLLNSPLEILGLWIPYYERYGYDPVSNKLFMILINFPKGKDLSIVIRQCQFYVIPEEEDKHILRRYIFEYRNLTDEWQKITNILVEKYNLTKEKKKFLNNHFIEMLRNRISSPINQISKDPLILTFEIDKINPLKYDIKDYIDEYKALIIPQEFGYKRADEILKQKSAQKISKQKKLSKLVDVHIFILEPPLWFGEFPKFSLEQKIKNNPWINPKKVSVLKYRNRRIFIKQNSKLMIECKNEINQDDTLQSIQIINEIIAVAHILGWPVKAVYSFEKGKAKINESTLDEIMGEKPLNWIFQFIDKHSFSYDDFSQSTSFIPHEQFTPVPKNKIINLIRLTEKISQNKKLMDNLILLSSADRLANEGAIGLSTLISSVIIYEFAEHIYKNYKYLSNFKQDYKKEQNQIKNIKELRNDLLHVRRKSYKNIYEINFEDYNQAYMLARKILQYWLVKFCESESDGTLLSLLNKTIWEL